MKYVNVTQSKKKIIMQANHANSVYTNSWIWPKFVFYFSSSNFYTMDAIRNMRPDISQLPRTSVAHVFSCITVYAANDLVIQKRPLISLSLQAG